VWSAHNSCVWRSDCLPALPTKAAPQNVLYVGRLIATKKPELLLKAFGVAVRRGAVPAASNLVFVGDGPLKDALQEECRTHNLMQRVRFEGHISDARRLREFYAEALVATSPGYLGLSAIQAFAAGVPMLVARDEPHSPEVEACREHFNTLFVASDSVEAWASAIGSAFQSADDLVRRRGEISADIADRYTYERMLETFHAVVGELDGRGATLE
jgi:glycosyltransferase involved in cell wall biosynthesis